MLIRFDPRELDGEMQGAAMDIILEVSNELINQLQIESPVGATGRLQESWQIFRTSEGVIYLGTRVDYAEDVWKGTGPHEPDFQDIKVWARRKLGNEDAAGPVFRKIKQEGTAPNPFVDRAIENTLDRTGQMRLGEF